MRRVASFAGLIIGGTLALAVAVGCGGPRDGTARGPVEPLELPAEVVEASAAITEESLLEAVTAIASDEMEGRAPGSAGDRRARAWLVERLRDLGCEPAFGGAFEQPFPIVGVASRMPESWAFVGPEGGEASFAWRDEYMAASGVQRESVRIDDAEVVFVGYGIEAPEQDWDDFEGADLSGKILLMLNDDPDWSPELFAGKRKLYYGRWTYKYESAARQGAAGAIIIHTTPSAGYPWSVVQTSWSGEQFEVPAGDEPRVAIQAWLTEGAARELVGLAGYDLEHLVAAAHRTEFAPMPLGIRTSIAFETSMRRTETANVAGVLPGREDTGEAIVYSAHHDHLGIGAPDATGDAIYNGALDNGVAIAQALAVGRAFAALPERAKRDVLILFPAAEEQGLLGSGYFASHPPRPPARIAGQINFELGNVWGRTRDVVIYGRGKSTLEDLVEAGALRQGRTVREEPDLRAGWFYRSDQFSLARIGVPAVWFKSGTDYLDRPPGWGEENARRWIAEHYHKPSDEVLESWDTSGLAEDATLAFWVGWTVAEGLADPAWYPGDEFEAVRLASEQAAP